MLYKEYLKTLASVKGTSVNLDARESKLEKGVHNIQDHTQSLLSSIDMNTNLDPTSSLALSHLPIMHKKF